jgi:hypothetical protein
MSRQNQNGIYAEVVFGPVDSQQQSPDDWFFIVTDRETGQDTRFFAEALLKRERARVAQATDFTLFVIAANRALRARHARQDETIGELLQENVRLAGELKSYRACSSVLVADCIPDHPVIASRK